MNVQRAGVAAVALLATVFGAAARDADGAADGTHAQRAAVVGAGGTSMHGGGWMLDGSIGQPAIAQVNASGVRLASGFWQASGAPGNGDLIFRDGFDPPSPIQSSAMPAARR